MGGDYETTLAAVASGVGGGNRHCIAAASATTWMMGLVLCVLVGKHVNPVDST